MATHRRKHFTSHLVHRPSSRRKRKGKRGTHHPASPSISHKRLEGHSPPGRPQAAIPLRRSARTQGRILALPGPAPPTPAATSPPPRLPSRHRNKGKWENRGRHFEPGRERAASPPRTPGCPPRPPVPRHDAPAAPGQRPPPGARTRRVPPPPGPPRAATAFSPGRGGGAGAAAQRRPSVGRGRVGGGGVRGEAAPRWGRGAGAQPCLTQPRRRLPPPPLPRPKHTHTHTTRTSAAATSRPHAPCPSGSPAPVVTWLPFFPTFSPPPFVPAPLPPGRSHRGRAALGCRVFPGSRFSPAPEGRVPASDPRVFHLPFTVGMVRHWNGLLREIQDAPSLTVFKTRLGGAQSNLL